jgi:hypothetical protein
MAKELGLPYLKCIFAGLAAVSIEVLAMAAWNSWANYEIRKSMPGIQLVSMWWTSDVWQLLIFSLLAFAAGFWWQHRRAR